MGNVVPHMSTATYPPSRIVNTNCGPFEGRRLIHEGDRMVDAFQGIPYAKPPVGDLRFKLPEPHEPWTEVKHTKAFGPRGIQKDMFPWVKYKLGPTSEDNLTLNVFTPVWTPPSEKGFAVLVFIHGGAFVSDSCVKYGDIGIAKHLVTKDVVVVTLQYRLGLLGFFTTGDEQCPGNLGLWDMTLALQWVQDNIGAFGGDASNVTIMGQSAGGCAVDLLSISPKSRDLFHKVIPMAGNANCDWSLSWNGVENCRKMAAKFGVESNYDSSRFLSDLRNLPANTFALGMDIDNTKEAIELFGPRMDGVFIPKKVSELRKEAPGKPRMVGCCRSEGLLMMFGGNTTFNLCRIEEMIAAQIKEKDHPYDFKQLRKKVLDKVVDMKRQLQPDEIKRANGEIFGDQFLNIGCLQSVIECIETSDAPVYFYSFDHFNPKMWGLMGSKLPYKDSTHCTELAYIFAVGIISSFDYTKEDIQMLDLTTTLWTNFAKYGDPNGAPGTPSVLGNISWQPATRENPQRHLEIDLESKMSEIYKNGRPSVYVNARRSQPDDILSTATNAVPTDDQTLVPIITTEEM